MPKGTVKWFNADRGFGFIKSQDGGDDVFVHITELRRIGLDTLREGQTIEFDLVQYRGRVVAGNLKLPR